MAVLLRTLGIPARVVVGYSTGSWDTETHVATVTTDDAHSWVEVLFPSFGWLSFEPTPYRLNPATLPYTNPTVPCTEVAGGCGGVDPAPVDPNDPGTTTGQGGLPGQLENLLRGEIQNGPQVGSRAGPLPGIDVETHYLAVPTHRTSARAIVGWVALALAALYLLVVPPWRILRRRARLRRAGRAPRELVLATYDVFTERAADLGYPRGAGETVEEYRRRLEDAVPPADGHLARLTALTEGAAYAPEPPAPEEAVRATEDASAAIRDLRRTTPFLRRMTGLYRRG
jgi:transglutaminase-like putative cysteine protease